MKKRKEKENQKVGLKITQKKLTLSDAIRLYKGTPSIAGVESAVNEEQGTANSKADLAGHLRAAEDQ